MPRTIGVYQRHPVAGGVEVVSGPGAEDPGTDDDDVRHLRRTDILTCVAGSPAVAARGGAGDRSAAKGTAVAAAGACQTRAGVQACLMRTAS